MAINTIDGFSKEPEEVKYKGIDLTTWLQDNESVTDWKVEAYEVSPTTFHKFDLEGVSYFDLVTYDDDNNIVDEKTRWEVGDDWENARITIQRPVDVNEVTETIIVGDNIGSDDPNDWVQRVNAGKFRVGIQGGEVGYTYRVSILFETDSGRGEQLHFPVNIIDVVDVE